MRRDLKDAIELAALERRRWDDINRRLRAGGDPLMTQFTPWHEATGLITYNQQIASGTSNIADHVTANFTVPAGAAQVSTFFCDAYMFYAQGTTDFAASAVLNFWVKIGATKALTVAVTMPASAATVKTWEVSAYVAHRTLGAAGTVMIQMLGQHYALASPFIFSGNMIATPATATIDTTISNNIALGFNWTGSSASNNNRCDVTYALKYAGAGT